MSRPTHVNVLHKDHIYRVSAIEANKLADVVGSEAFADRIARCKPFLQVFQGSVYALGVRPWDTSRMALEWGTPEYDAAHWVVEVPTSFDYRITSREKIVHELRQRAALIGKNDMRHYSAVLAEASRIGWPTSYVNDLQHHDLWLLQRQAPSEPFAWVLRECGTHIVYPGSTLRAVDFSDKCHLYWWDGKTLASCDAATFDDHLIVRVH